VEDMNISEVEDMNMLEEHERMWNQQPEVEDMNMVGIHMVEVEVEGMDMHGGEAPIEGAAGGGWDRYVGGAPDEREVRGGGYVYGGGYDGRGG
jgi:hypothetical protein